MARRIRVIMLLAILMVGGDSLGMAREWATLPAASPPGPPEGLVNGQLHWTTYSTCEYNYQFLSYYIQGCSPGQKVWLYHPVLPPAGRWSGQQIWAEGTLVDNGCLVLDMRGHPFTLCPSPTGCQAGN